MGNNSTDVSGMMDRNPKSNSMGMSKTGRPAQSMRKNGAPMPMHDDHPGMVMNKGMSMKPPKM